MFTQPAPAPPTLATSPASATSPTRPSRLRGLSYLRNYTHNHLHSRDNTPSPSSKPSTLARATSYPTPTSSPTSSRTTPTATQRTQTPQSGAAPTFQRSTTLDLQNNISSGQEISGSTSGWLPTVGGHSAASASSLVVLSEDVTTSEDSDMNRPCSASPGLSRTGDGAFNTSSDESAGRVATPAHSVQQNNGSETTKYTIRFSQHQDVRAPRPSLVFSPMGRTLPTGREIIRVGRYSERDTQPNQPANLSNAAPVGFKSKVVSRRHCEFWCDNGTWFIRDVKSSSGTFLNHVRLSAPGTESKPFPVKDGDIVQLGIDFKGGEEMIFRCVKIRLELNRAWQNSLNTFNVASHKRLRNMAKQIQSPSGASSATSSQDCSICLGPVAPCQSLFVAPCSHTWHYKCIRRVINGPQWPHFICPNCRAVADLEADVDEPYPEGEWEDIDAVLEAEQNQTSLPTQPEVVILANGEFGSSHDGVADVPSSEEHAHDEIPQSTVEEVERYMSNIQINDENEPTTTPEASSNSSVAPIDIARPGRSRRQSTSATAAGGSVVERTPSPSSRLAHPRESSAAPDGPMTPRNDAGPFVFDGSAGRGAETRAASMSLAAAADMVSNEAETKAA